MSNSKPSISVRWFYLAIGVIAMLFAGILYAWSILKSPLTTEFGWGPSELALNFTLAMSFFCIGGLLGANLSKRFGCLITLIIAGILSAAGFILTAVLRDASVIMLYFTYGVLAGLGIGIAYNVIISTVSAWFPDKKGLCSGFLMMGFGASALILGNIANALFQSDFGWRSTYIILGITLCVVLCLAATILKKPSPETTLPKPKETKSTEKQPLESKDYSTKEMLCRPSFWMAFVCISFLAAVGSSVISFAKDLALSVQAPETLAVSLVGVLSVCNGFGRILTGTLFDVIGRRKTMLSANILTICASGVTLLAVFIGSLPLCIIGLCLTGMSYGACPTITSAFTSSYFGLKHFPTNMAVMTFTSMGGSLIATMSNKIFEVTGGFTATFAMLLGLSTVALILNFLIRRP